MGHCGETQLQVGENLIKIGKLSGNLEVINANNNVASIIIMLLGYLGVVGLSDCEFRHDDKCIIQHITDVIIRQMQRKCVH